MRMRKKAALVLVLMTLVTSLAQAESWKFVKLWHKTFYPSVEGAAVSVDSAGKPFVTVSEMEKLWRVDADGNQVLVKSVGRTPYFSSNGRYIYVRALGEEGLIDRDGRFLGRLTRKLPTFQTQWSKSYLPRPEVSNQGYLVGRIAADTLLFFNPQGRFLRFHYPGYQITRDQGYEGIPKSRFSWDGSRFVVRLGERRRFIFLDREGNQVGLSDSIMMGSYAIASNGDIWVIGGDTKGQVSGRLFANYIARNGQTKFKFDIGQADSSIIWGSEASASRFGEYAVFNCRARLFVVQKSPPALRFEVKTGSRLQEQTKTFWAVWMPPGGQCVVTIYRQDKVGTWLRLYGLDGAILDEVEIPGARHLVGGMDGDYFVIHAGSEADLYKVERR